MSTLGMAMSPLRVVWWKEVKENLRDRRAVLNALIIGPLLTPLLMLALIQMAVQRESRQADQAITVPVIGARYAPELMAFLAEGGVRAGPGLADPEKAVVSREKDAVIRIPAAYPQQIAHGEPAEVQLIYDSSRGEASRTVDRVRTLVRAYSAEQGAIRLLARGIAPATANPVMVSSRDQSTSQSRAGLMFSMLPYLLILTVQMGGMYLAIDLTAGERERQSLEPLLINPVPRWKILLAKLAATTSFAYASLLLSILAFSLVGRLLPSDKLGFELHLGLAFMLEVWLMMLPLTVFLAGLQILVAGFARSYREAQTYLGLMSMVPALPSLFISMFPFKSAAWMYAVPLLSQNLGIIELLRSGSLGWTSLGLCLLGSTVLAILIVVIAVRVFNTERTAISG
ncbi:ABC transporter permease [Frateuria aurantia]